jgi:hypothetical protein
MDTVENTFIPTRGRLILFLVWNTLKGISDGRNMQILGPWCDVKCTGISVCVSGLDWLRSRHGRLLLCFVLTNCRIYSDRVLEKNAKRGTEYSWSSVITVLVTKHFGPGIRRMFFERLLPLFDWKFPHDSNLHGCIGYIWLKSPLLYYCSWLKPNSLLQELYSTETSMAVWVTFDWNFINYCVSYIWLKLYQLLYEFHLTETLSVTVWVMFQFTVHSTSKW